MSENKFHNHVEFTFVFHDMYLLDEKHSAEYKIEGKLKETNQC